MAKRKLDVVDQSGRAYAGSKKQIQTYVNQFPDLLNDTIAQSFGDAFPAKCTVRWVSPLAAEGYREYWDSKFLRALGFQEHSDALSLFWPNGGPHWDGLARLEDGLGGLVGCVLVEAKSHVREFYQKDTRATAASLELIMTSLGSAKKWLRVQESILWTGFKDADSCLYQYANRLAHLYFFRKLLGIPAFLVNLHFTDDPHSPTDLEAWQAEIEKIHEELGLASLPSCHANVFLSADPEMNTPQKPTLNSATGFAGRSKAARCLISCRQSLRLRISRTWWIMHCCARCCSN